MKFLKLWFSVTGAAVHITVTILDCSILCLKSCHTLKKIIDPELPINDLLLIRLVKNQLMTLLFIYLFIFLIYMKWGKALIKVSVDLGSYHICY